MPLQERPLAKHANKLPKGCHTWLQVWDKMGEEFEKHRTDTIQYVTASRDYHEDTELYGVAEIKKDWLLARVAEELLPVRPTTGTVYSILQSRYSSFERISEENTKWLESLLDIALRLR